MRRITIDPRPNWKKRVEEYGLYYHTLRGEPYWDESACYQFTPYEVDRIEEATNAASGSPAAAIASAQVA